MVCYFYPAENFQAEEISKIDKAVEKEHYR